MKSSTARFAYSSRASFVAERNGCLESVHSALELRFAMSAARTERIRLNELSGGCG